MRVVASKVHACCLIQREYTNHHMLDDLDQFVSLYNIPQWVSWPSEAASADVVVPAYSKWG